jgi:hypothetical protein
MQWEYLEQLLEPVRPVEARTVEPKLEPAY